MKEFLERTAHLSPKQLQLLAARLQQRVETLEQAKVEPIAVIGIGCRFPGGVRDPKSYWQLLSKGIDAVTEVPTSRWDIEQYYNPDPDTPGAISTRFGSFIDEIDQFDPAFFGISPREAKGMDPQQRILLEVCWEALEHAAISPDQLQGTATGMFLGISAGDYFRLQLDASGERGIDAYLASGAAHSVASGRISYVLGLHGPSVSIDTACSSSLVATHLAIQSLRNGECDAALAGGVNLLLAPEISITLSKARMLSPNGRCKTFAADADGYVRGEGCGVVVLKRLSQAQKDGDTILAVIEGTAMNQDGRSNGLTAPNGPAQEAVIRAALENANLEPEAISYVETHGTGTSLGDPIEVQALGAVLAQDRQQPLLLGSVKTNIGHLEASAGVAGLIKAVLAVQHGVIPPHLHLEERNPYIPWDNFPALQIPQDNTPLPEVNGRRRAGVSSFGFSGTNVHMIVGSPPVVESKTAKAAEPARPLHLITLSAKTDTALKQLATQMVSSLSQTSPNVGDLSFTTTTGRAHHEHRLTMAATNTAQVQEALAAWSTGQPHTAVQTSIVSSTRRPRVAFLFTGQGAQYAGMSRELYDQQPTFRHILEECDRLLRPYLERPLLDVIFAEDETAALLNETAYTQPALFAVEYALAKLWQSWGVTPSIVMGHSVGEYVAACVAGLFSLEDGLKLIAARGRLMQQLPAGGAMAAVFAAETTVRAAIDPYADQVSIAAINGPANVVISGAGQAVTNILEQLATAGIKSRRLTVSHAFHSPLMAPMLDEFEQIAGTTTFKSLQIGLLSNVTGKLATSTEIGNAQYWRDHVRQPVRFADAIQALAADEYEIFLEIGPSPTLISMGQRCLEETSAAWLPSLRKGKSDWSQLVTTLGKLYLKGAAIDWSGVARDGGPYQKLVLPRYPFQRERFWIEEKAGQATWAPDDRHTTTRFPLLGQKLSIAGDQQTIYQTAVSPRRFPYLHDHLIYDRLVLPSPVYMEMALAAATEEGNGRGVKLSNVVVHQALFLTEDHPKRLQCILTRDGSDTTQCAIYSQADETWQKHMSSTLEPLPPLDRSPDRNQIVTIQQRCQETIAVPHFYQLLQGLGLHFGPRFQGVTTIQRTDGESLARMLLPADLASAGDTVAYAHPALLDACFHMVGAALPEAKQLDDAFLLLGIDEIDFHESLPTEFWTHAQLKDATRSQTMQETFSATMQLLADDGRLLAEFRGMHFKRAKPEALLPAQEDPLDEMMFEIDWPEKAHLQPTAVSLMQPQDIKVALEPHLQHVYDDQALKLYDEFQPKLDRLCRHYITAALEKMGLSLTPNTTFSAQSLAERLGVIKQHRKLFARLLEILAEDGILQQDNGRYRVAHAPGTVDLPNLWSDLLATYPIFDAELNLTGRCARELVGVLRGQADPLQLLFPGGSLSETEKLYQDSPAARAYNNLIKEAVQAATSTVPPQNKIRILEIGAGTGGTSAYVLPHLPPERTEYVFTDLSPLFTTKAQEKFKAYPFVEYRLLDIAQDPASQGYEPHTFDIVIGANVLHATPNLSETLRHVKQLLAPNGLLMLLEGTAPQRFGDLTVGYTEGWWAFEDTEVRNYALISRKQWGNVLEDAGFTGFTAVPPEHSDGILAQQAIIMAQAPATAVAPGDWLIFADQQGVGRRLAASLAKRDQRCVLVHPGAQFTKLEDDQYQINPEAEGSFAQLLQEVKPQHAAAWRSILHLWALDTTLPDNASAADIMAEQQTKTGSILALTKALSGHHVDNFWLATQGAQAVVTPGEAAPTVAPAPSTIWGLSHVIALEHPDLHCKRIDLDPEATAEENASRLLDELWAPTASDDQIAFRQSARRVRRLIPARRVPNNATLALPAEAAYLLTGGLGGLGLLVAEWLVAHGARHLLLTGRSTPSETAQAAITNLENAGANVKYVAGNVADIDDLARIFNTIEKEMPALRGVFHMAGVLDDGILLQQNWARFEKVMQAKVVGSWLLHQQTQEMSLDHFVLFSSGASLLGSPGQGNHAAANAFMDTLAFFRQTHNLPAVSINWGAWDIGAAVKGSVTERKDVLGFSSDTGLRALTEIMQGQANGQFYTQVGMVALNWQQLPETISSSGVLAHFSDRIRQKTQTAVKQQTQTAVFADTLEQQLTAAPVNRRPALLMQHLRQQAAHTLGIASAANVSVRQPLQELGLDSLMAVELRNALADAINRPLPATLLFEYPTLSALADYIAELMLPDDDSEPAAAAPASATIETEDDSPADDYDELSEDEMANLLLEKLEELE